MGKPVPVESVDWKKAVETNQPWLRTVIAARGGRNADEVGEIYQNLAVAVAEQKFAPGITVRVAPWLYHLARIQTAMYFRKKKRYGERITRFQEESRPTEADGRQSEPIDWLIAKERADLVSTALARIPDGAREILLLKYHHSLSYKEIAEKLGLTNQAVQMRLHKARNMLRQEILARDADAGLA